MRMVAAEDQAEAARSEAQSLRVQVSPFRNERGKKRSKCFHAPTNAASQIRTILLYARVGASLICKDSTRTHYAPLNTQENRGYT